VAAAGKAEEAAATAAGHPTWWGKPDGKLTQKERADKNRQQNINRRERWGLYNLERTVADHP
jgi:hypothetical protein